MAALFGLREFIDYYSLFTGKHGNPSWIIPYLSSYLTFHRLRMCVPHDDGSVPVLIILLMAVWTPDTWVYASSSKQLYGHTPASKAQQ